MTYPGPAWPAIAEHIHRGGPIPFGVYQDACLYGPGGFYTAGRGAGRRADFVTSPSLGPLFGAVLARAIDAEWERQRRPDPWVVAEVGAGDGTLAAAVLDAAPACRGALRYVCVEVSPAGRTAAADRLPVEIPALVLGPRLTIKGGEAPDGVAQRGPLVTVLEDLPAEPFTGMVVANELLDNLAVELVEWRAGRWNEVRIGESAGQAAEILVPAQEEAATLASRLLAWSAPADGVRLPLQPRAAHWLTRALGLVDRGRVVCIDYCAATTAELAARPQDEWLRTYRGQGRGGPPLELPGDQDITCQVAIDQLALVRTPSEDSSQADWLAAFGIGALEAEARSAWDAAAARPDLGALKAKSRVAEAGALTDPAGLGAFRVLEWAS